MGIEDRSTVGDADPDRGVRWRRRWWRWWRRNSPPDSAGDGYFYENDSNHFGRLPCTGLMHASHSYAHWQHLYLASDINGSGKITGLAYKYASAVSSAITCTGATIKLGHTLLSAVTSTFADNVANGKGGQTTVLSNGTLSFPADAAGTWHTVEFTTPFDYNGNRQSGCRC